jgi:hypothetical protein
MSDNQHTVSQNELVRARNRLNNEILQLSEINSLSSTTVKIVWNVGTLVIYDLSYSYCEIMSNFLFDYIYIQIVLLHYYNYVIIFLSEIFIIKAYNQFYNL